jgi:hypothetical protein
MNEQIFLDKRRPLKPLDLLNPDAEMVDVRALL